MTTTVPKEDTMRKATLLSLVVAAVLVFAVASASAQAPPPPPYGPAITL